MIGPTNFTLITGASSGIGRAISTHLSQERNLILHARNLQRLEETKSFCSTTKKQVIWQFDLAETEKIESSLTDFLQSNGASVESFIHCASILKLLPFRSITYAQITETIKTNFISAAQIISVLLKKRINNRQLKTIVFISSTASKFGAKAFTIYSASKGALDSFMRSLAVELAPDVRVNSVLPGGIKTQMTEQIFSNPELIARMEKEYPLGLGEADYIADLVMFLISDKAKWITGQQFIIDGGRTINITA